MKPTERRREQLGEAVLDSVAVGSRTAEVMSVSSDSVKCSRLWSRVLGNPDLLGRRSLLDGSRLVPSRAYPFTLSLVQLSTAQIGAGTKPMLSECRAKALQAWNIQGVQQATAG